MVRTAPSAQTGIVKPSINRTASIDDMHGVPPTCLECQRITKWIVGHGTTIAKCNFTEQNTASGHEVCQIRLPRRQTGESCLTSQPNRVVTRKARAAKRARVNVSGTIPQRG